MLIEKKLTGCSFLSDERHRRQDQHCSSLRDVHFHSQNDTDATRNHERILYPYVYAYTDVHDVLV